MTEIEKAEKMVKAANLRVLGAGQRANAAAHRRQAESPIYPGQDDICNRKASQIEALAARSEAQASLLEAEEMENTRAKKSCFTCKHMIIVQRYFTKWNEPLKEPCYQCYRNMGMGSGQYFTKWEEVTQ